MDCQAGTNKHYYIKLYLLDYLLRPQTILLKRVMIGTKYKVGYYSSK